MAHTTGGVIGVIDREVFSDASPIITYAQRTADNRLAFGSRGAYRFGGQPRSDFSADRRAFSSMRLLSWHPERVALPDRREILWKLGLLRRLF